MALPDDQASIQLRELFGNPNEKLNRGLGWVDVSKVSEFAWEQLNCIEQVLEKQTVLQDGLKDLFTVFSLTETQLHRQACMWTQNGGKQKLVMLNSGQLGLDVTKDMVIPGGSHVQPSS